MYSDFYKVVYLSAFFSKAIYFQVGRSLLLSTNIDNDDAFMCNLTEFRTNGNWGYDVPIHPGLSLLKSQPDSCHVSKHNLHTTSKLCTLRPYSI